MIHFHPDALVYKVDRALVRALISRGAFQGLRDGREDDRGEASIVSFKIHHSNGEVETDDMYPAGETLSEPEEEEAGPLLLRLPTAPVAVGVAVLITGLIAVRCGLRSSRSLVGYEQVSLETSSPVA